MYSFTCGGENRQMKNRQQSKYLAISDFLRTRSRGRTGTDITVHRILSPACLPIPPSGQIMGVGPYCGAKIIKYPSNYKKNMPGGRLNRGSSRVTIVVLRPLTKTYAKTECKIRVDAHIKNRQKTLSLHIENLPRSGDCRIGPGREKVHENERL